MPNSMSDDIHKGHRKRVKARFITGDLDDFEHHNVLELLLFYAIPRMDTNKIAHNLINHFGSISEVFDAQYEDLIKLDYITENVATLIKLVPNISRVYLNDKNQEQLTLNSSQKIGEYFTHKFVGRTEELVYIMCLDSLCRVISCDVLTKGTVVSANISIRKITEKVIRHNACSVVLAHNHPRGLAIPSNEDVITTIAIKNALKMLDVTFLDHIVVAQNDYASLAQQGYI